MVDTPQRVRRDTVRWGTGWARLGNWRGQPHIAQITVAATGPAPSPVVDRCVGHLRTNGFQSVFTSALAPEDTKPFLDEGFEVHERLHLLEHDLRTIPPITAPTRRARRRDEPAVLQVDQLGFDDFWQFSATDLRDAIAATPNHRYRVVADGDLVLAYAITGRAAGQGYLQRLAVHPDARRAGLGTTLVADALRWLRRRGVQRALVNTQMGNGGAVELYERCGFRQLPISLAVLGRTL
ncbi:MAG: GNAT family N-acetyltransferase [Acidimicrobiia bacterium]